MASGGLNIEQRILDSLGWGVLVVGRWSRTILAYNARMTEMTGVSEEQAVGRSVMEVFGHLRGMDFESIDDEIRRTGRFASRCVRLERPGGEVVFRQLQGDVLEGTQGEEEGVVASVQDVTEREWMRACFSRYLAPQVAEFLIAKGGLDRLAGQEVEVAILVADMREFTTAAEGLTPDELFETLNAYLAPMVEIVALHGGTVDKFTGDGFMAVFGAPLPQGGDARRALSAALDLRERVEGLNQVRRSAGQPAMGLGFGVHWGPAAAGSLGSPLRMEYTVVGDTVNLAHRLQALAGAGEIFASQDTVRATGDEFLWGEGQWVRIRGRKAPVKVASLLGRSPEVRPAPSTVS